ncbi:hypothetical protein [Deinococcus aquiradiocola]|uniref:DUF3108 domain-containing protein n=1 Tax=Deinococcus aquiradiocola TaxID=393059 RepID=A0A917PQF3_9DEIO|nr:hypothetical protein [Deinococcus aquiradiocola]GGJ87259.1 hypothetical protein GCM10008939_34130 [Deinococcus aquiradiocola]
MKRLLAIGMLALLSAGSVYSQKVVSEVVLKDYPGIIQISQSEQKYGAGNVIYSFPFEGLLTNFGNFVIESRDADSSSVRYRVSQGSDTSGVIKLAKRSKDDLINDVEVMMLFKANGKRSDIRAYSFLAQPFINFCATARPWMTKKSVTWLERVSDQIFEASIANRDFSYSEKKDHVSIAVTLKLTPQGKVLNVHTVVDKLPGPSSRVTACTFGGTIRETDYR